jgi:hypothetical protein
MKYKHISLNKVKRKKKHQLRSCAVCARHGSSSAEEVCSTSAKGMMSAESNESAIKILSCITIPISDSIFDKQETCLLMHKADLLHWLDL